MKSMQLWFAGLLVLGLAVSVQADYLLEETFDGASNDTYLENWNNWVEADGDMKTYTAGSSGNPFATTASYSVSGTSTVRMDHALTRSISLSGGGVYEWTSDMYAFTATGTGDGSAQSGMSLMTDVSGGAVVLFEYQYDSGVKWRIRVYDGVGGYSQYFTVPKDKSGIASLSMTLDLDAGTINASVTTASGTSTFSEITLPSTFQDLGSIGAVRLNQDRRSSRQGLWVDNVYVTPEPATMCLLASGAGMFFLKRRK